MWNADETPFGIAFGDVVRIRSVPETDAAGLAGCEGEVLGLTTPSVTGIEVIGETDDDIAFSVSLEGKEGEFWFTPDLIELIERGVDLEISIGEARDKWVKRADGSWERRSAGEKSSKKRWWHRR